MLLFASFRAGDSSCPLQLSPRPARCHGGGHSAAGQCQVQSHRPAAPDQEFRAGGGRRLHRGSAGPSPTEDWHPDRHSLPARSHSAQSRQVCFSEQCCGSVESVSFPWIRIRIKSLLDPKSGSVTNDMDPDQCCGSASIIMQIRIQDPKNVHMDPDPDPRG